MIARILRSALLLGSIVAPACGDAVDYRADLVFIPPTGVDTTDRALRINVCLDPLGLDCDELSMLAAAEESSGQYEFDPMPDDGRVILVARPDSRVGNAMFIRAWLSDKSMCCGLACSPDFLDPRGYLIDPSGKERVFHEIQMETCPAAVACPMTTSECQCDCKVLPGNSVTDLPPSSDGGDDSGPTRDGGPLPEAV